jgi:hypothetical protein
VAEVLQTLGLWTLPRRRGQELWPLIVHESRNIMLRCINIACFLSTYRFFCDTGRIFEGTSQRNMTKP